MNRTKAIDRTAGGESETSFNLVCKSLRRDLGGGRSNGQCLQRNPGKVVNISVMALSVLKGRDSTSLNLSWKTHSLPKLVIMQSEI